MMIIEYTSDGLVCLIAGGQRLPLIGFNVENTVEEIEDAVDETITHQRVTGATVTFKVDFTKVRIVEAPTGLASGSSNSGLASSSSNAGPNHAS